MLLDHYDRLTSLIEMSFFQSSKFYHYTFNLPYVRLRYTFGGHRPSETNHHTMSFKKISQDILKKFYYIFRLSFQLILKNNKLLKFILYI